LPRVEREAPSSPPERDGPGRFSPPGPGNRSGRVRSAGCPSDRGLDGRTLLRAVSNLLTGAADRKYVAKSFTTVMRRSPVTPVHQEPRVDGWAAVARRLTPSPSSCLPRRELVRREQMLPHLRRKPGSSQHVAGLVGVPRACKRERGGRHERGRCRSALPAANVLGKQPDLRSPERLGLSEVPAPRRVVGG